MAQNAQRPLESKYARKKREEGEGTRPLFTFAPPTFAQADHLPQSEPVPPAPLQSTHGGIVDGKTWQTGRVKSYNDDESGSGAVTVGGVDYPFDFSKHRHFSPEELAPGTHVFVKLYLNSQKDRQEVKAVRLMVPADMPSATWHEGIILNHRVDDKDMFADRFKYRGVGVPRAVLLRDLGPEVFNDGLKVYIQVEELHAKGPRATALRLR